MGMTYEYEGMFDSQYLDEYNSIATTIIQALAIPAPQDIKVMDAFLDL